MKTAKKIWMGIATLAAIALFSVAIARPALADTASDITNASNFTFVDGAHITADVGSLGNITFTDNNVSDNFNTGSSGNYNGDNRNFTSDNSAFCKPGNISDSNGISGDIPYGVNIDPAASLATTTDVHGNPIPLKAQIKLGYYSNGTSGNCVGVLLTADVGNSNNLAASFLQWDGANITSLNNQSDNNTRYNNITLTPVKGVDTLYTANPKNGCADYAVLLDAAGGNSGKFYNLDTVGGGDKGTPSPSQSGYPALFQYASQAGFDSACLVIDGSYLPSISIAGTAGQAAPGSTSSGPTTSSDSGSACVASGSTGLEWLLCPVTTSISSATDQINSQVDKQLDFNVKGNLADQDQVHLAWSIIKNITSALVVVILLFIVIAQALGGGPVDAYTIKKLLPKLVIAVIGMQLSWDLCKWLITLANDAGHGLEQIMTLPFGGTSLNLNTILHRLNPAWAQTSQGIIPVALVAGAIIGFMTLPAAFVTIFGLFIGIFAALMVLLFRNVLIVALTIFSPLAFLAWVLPGTQNLWKTWKDNFSKLLMLFPLLVGIIYTGRIFAWIAADASNPGLIDYLTVLVAFFGPYFIIFKAYKWGGGMLSAAGTGIAGARKSITQANAPWLKTLGERAQGNIANRYLQAGENERKAYEEVGKTDRKISRLQDRIAQRKKDGLSTATEEALLMQLHGRRQSQQEAALQAQKSNGRFQRAMWRVGSGKPIPSSRQQLETLARGAQYKEELVKQKQALIHNDYVEQLNSGASVSDAKKYIRDKYGFGNMERDASGKMTGKAKDGYTERAFWNWVVDTRSAMELGDTTWRTNNGKDRDIAKTKGFMAMMNADPQRYAYVAQNLPELQPFNQALGGGPKAIDYMPGGSKFRELQRTRPAVAATIAAGGTSAEDLAETLADNARYTKMLNNLEHTSDLSSWRPEQLQMMADNVTKLKGLGITGSEFELEFKNIMNELKQSQSPEDRNTLSRLRGGKKSARAAVDDVMGQRWLEDAVGLPVQVGNIQREAPAPTPEELQKDNLRIAYIERLLVPSASRATNKDREEFTQTLAEAPEYSLQAHNSPQLTFYREFLDMAEAVRQSNNAQTIHHWNELITETERKIQAHAQRIIQSAAAQNLSQTEQERISNEETAKALGKIRMFERRRVPTPTAGSDPTELLVPHVP